MIWLGTGPGASGRGTLGSTGPARQLHTHFGCPAAGVFGQWSISHSDCSLSDSPALRSSSARRDWPWIDESLRTVSRLAMSSPKIHPRPGRTASRNFKPSRTLPSG